MRGFTLEHYQALYAREIRTSAEIAAGHITSDFEGGSLEMSGIGAVYMDLGE